MYKVACLLVLAVAAVSAQQQAPVGPPQAPVGPPQAPAGPPQAPVGPPQAPVSPPQQPYPGQQPNPTQRPGFNPIQDVMQTGSGLFSAFGRLATTPIRLAKGLFGGLGG